MLRYLSTVSIRGRTLKRMCKLQSQGWKPVTGTRPAGAILADKRV